MRKATFFPLFQPDNKFYLQPNLHPLVSILDFSGTTPKVYASRMNFGFYAVYLKEVQCGNMIAACLAVVFDAYEFKGPIG